MSTDADYNASSRYLDFKIDIYFTGQTLTVTTANYLVEAEVLEETGATGSNPFGVASSNELTFTLLNKDGMFSLSNIASPYAGKMKAGVQVKAYIKPKSVGNWDKLGTFYITDWQSSITGVSASVTANDQLQEIFNIGDMPTMPVAKNQTMAAFYSAIFAALGKAATVDAALSQVIPFAYNLPTTKEQLQVLSQDALAVCFCDRDGNIVVKPLSKTGAARTITDADQIVDIGGAQSILSLYDGVTLSYLYTQIDKEQQILSLSDHDISTNVNVKADFSNSPIMLITQIKTVAAANIFVASYVATPYDIALVFNATNAAKCSTTILGCPLLKTETSLKDTGKNILSMKATYIQTDAQAATHKALLKQYTASLLPRLSVTVRGNPRIQIGDLIRVNSVQHNVNFTGIVQRATYSYSGGLSGTLELLNSSIFGG